MDFVGRNMAWGLVLWVAVTCAAAGGVFLIQQGVDLRRDRFSTQVEELRSLPPGEYLRPVLLGYNHLGADVLWLRLLQVLGKRSNTPDEYEWLFHALDVVTTLDPLYAYAYRVGGVAMTEVAGRVDLSNKILEKGLTATPDVWEIPFTLGYNHFFYLHDDAKAAEYMTRASNLPGRPPFIPFLATKLYAGAGSPEVALNFMAEMWRQTQDPQIKERLELRIKELIIERDIRMLEDTLAHYRTVTGRLPLNLRETVSRGLLPALPQEPFGGEYRYDAKTGEVTSSTHPERLRVKKRGQLPPATPSPAPLPQGETGRR